MGNNVELRLDGSDPDGNSGILSKEAYKAVSVADYPAYVDEATSEQRKIITVAIDEQNNGAVSKYFYDGDGDYGAHKFIGTKNSINPRLYGLSHVTGTATGSTSHVVLFTKAIEFTQLTVNSKIQISFVFQAIQCRVRIGSTIIAEVSQSLGQVGNYTTSLFFAGSLTNQFIVGAVDSPTNVGYGVATTEIVPFTFDFSANPLLTISLKNSEASQTASLYVADVIIYNP